MATAVAWISAEVYGGLAEPVKATFQRGTLSVARQACGFSNEPSEKFGGGCGQRLKAALAQRRCRRRGSRVEAARAGAVRVTLRQAQGPLLANLAIAGFGIASPRAVERWGTEFGRHPVGSGAFRVTEWRAGEAVVLEANPDYWGENRQAERLLHDDVARLFIVHDQVPLAFSARVHGYVANPTGVELFNTVEVR